MGYFNNEGWWPVDWKAKMEMSCMEPAEEDCLPEEALQRRRHSKGQNPGIYFLDWPRGRNGEVFEKLEWRKEFQSLSDPRIHELPALPRVAVRRTESEIFGFRCSFSSLSPKKDNPNAYGWIFLFPSAFQMLWNLFFPPPTHDLFSKKIIFEENRVFHRGKYLF